jgi:hypothetical protein
MNDVYAASSQGQGSKSVFALKVDPSGKEI